MSLEIAIALVGVLTPFLYLILQEVRRFRRRSIRIMEEGSVKVFDILERANKLLEFAEKAGEVLDLLGDLKPLILKLQKVTKDPSKELEEIAARTLKLFVERYNDDEEFRVYLNGLIIGLTSAAKAAVLAGKKEDVDPKTGQPKKAKGLVGMLEKAAGVAQALQASGILKGM